jgi:nitrite reductase (NADH) large subunit
MRSSESTANGAARWQRRHALKILHRKVRATLEPQMSKPRLVLIGNGMAGVRTVEELLKIKPDHYDITIFGAEPHPNYNRILLSPVLAGEMTIQEIVLNELDWYKENGIKLHTGKQIKTIDRVKRKVIAEDGTEEEYDRLLIATGSTPFMLPIPGNDLPGVIGYRDIKDTDEMIEAAACTSTRWSSAAACSAWKRPTASSCAAWM